MERTVNKISPWQLIASVSALTLLSACSATNDINSGNQSTNGQVVPIDTPSSDNDNLPLDVGGAQTGGNGSDSSSGQNNADSGSDSSGADDTPADTGTGSSADNTSSGTNAPVIDASLVANASSVSCEAPLATFRDTMVAMVNESRMSARQCGASAAPAVGVVQWNDQLADAAVVHAQDMVSVNFFSHTGSNGLSVADRAEAAGYDWRAVGENIAAGQRDIEEVHQGWLDSAGHCRNIMNSLYTEIGAACVNGDATDFGSYWVVVFGDQR
ncbi:MAG: CAP domain-containing protein [Pseudomonadota bacterium]